MNPYCTKMKLNEILISNTKSSYNIKLAKRLIVRPNQMHLAVL